MSIQPREGEVKDSTIENFGATPDDPSGELDREERLPGEGARDAAEAGGQVGTTVRDPSPKGEQTGVTVRDLTSTGEEVGTTVRDLAPAGVEVGTTVRQPAMNAESETQL